MTNKQKQVMLSGILGDGCLRDDGSMLFSCIHKEYMDFKFSILGNSTNGVHWSKNPGYKKDGEIFKLRISTTPYGKELNSYSFQDIVNEMDELGIALWLLDDGSRHKKNNFYNINTHAIPRDIEESVLIPFLNKYNIFPSITSETKKDGRYFTYLYVSKWNGAMEISRMIRRLNIKCYDYKLMPIELEDAYFKFKDVAEFKEASAFGKTKFIKKYLGISYKEHIHTSVTSVEMCK